MLSQKLNPELPVIFIVGASLGNFDFDAWSLLVRFAQANSSRNLPSAVTVSETEITHKDPLTLEMLNSSSLLTPYFIIKFHYYVVISSWMWDDVIFGMQFKT